MTHRLLRLDKLRDTLRRAHCSCGDIAIVDGWRDASAWMLGHGQHPHWPAAVLAMVRAGRMTVEQADAFSRGARGVG